MKKIGFLALGQIALALLLLTLPFPAHATARWSFGGKPVYEAVKRSATFLFTKKRVTPGSGSRSASSSGSAQSGSGSSPTSGGGIPPDPDLKVPLFDPGSPTEVIPPGCIVLKVTQIAGHLVKIEYAFKKELEGNDGMPPTSCPAIDEAYIWGQMNKLNNSTTVNYVIQQPTDDAIPLNDINKTFYFDTEKPATKCNPGDDSVCMGFKGYYEAATNPDGAVWTSDPDYLFKNFQFYRVGGIKIIPSGKSDPLTLLGYAKMKFFYDDDLDKNGNPTGNFTPRFYLVVRSGKEWFPIQGEVKILHPTADVTVTTPTTSPIWKLSVFLHDGVFGLEENIFDLSKSFDGVVTTTASSSSCSNSSLNPTLPKSGYAATFSEDCALNSETIGITLKMRGLNRFDFPIQTITYKLTQPTLTLQESGCEQTLGGVPTGGVTGIYVSCKSVDEKGKVKFHYEIAERKVISDPPTKGSGSQGTGEVKDNPPPPVVVNDGSGIKKVISTVPWVGKVTLTPQGFKEGVCPQASKTVEVVTDGVKGKESEDLTFAMEGVAQGNLIMERSYECYKFTLSVKGLDNKDLVFDLEKGSVNPVEEPYTPEFSNSVSESCTETAQTFLDGNCDDVCCWTCWKAWATLGITCLTCSDDAWSIDSQGSDTFIVNMTTRHVKDIAIDCHMIDKDAPTNGGFKPTLDTVKMTEEKWTTDGKTNTPPPLPGYKEVKSVYDGVFKTHYNLGKKGNPDEVNKIKNAQLICGVKATDFWGNPVTGVKPYSSSKPCKM